LIGIDEFTKEQFDSLESLIKEFDVSYDTILGHYMVSPKTCPNFDVDKFKIERSL